MNIRFSDEKMRENCCIKQMKLYVYNYPESGEKTVVVRFSGRDKDGRRKVLKRRKYQKKEKIRRKQHFCLDLNGKLQQL